MVNALTNERPPVGPEPYPADYRHAGWGELSCLARFLRRSCRRLENRAGTAGVAMAFCLMLWSKPGPKCLRDRRPRRIAYPINPTATYDRLLNAIFAESYERWSRSVSELL
jgi:hypothetical protein